MANPTKSCGPDGTTCRAKQPDLSMISQALLAEYEELKPRVERFKLLDEQLKSGMDAGTPVDPGPLVPKLTVYYRRRLLQDFIFKRLALTTKEIAKLRAGAPEVRHRSLAVVVKASPLLANQATPIDGHSVEEPLCERTGWEAMDEQMEEDHPHDLVQYSN